MTRPTLCCYRGFTLIELMVTLSILVILMTIAAPNFSAFKRNAELSTQATTLMATLNAARGEAMKRGRTAMITPTDAANWRNGWVAFVDMDRSQTFDASTDITVMSVDAAPAYVTFSASSGSTANASPPYLMFDASGYSKTKTGGFGALTLSIARNDVATSDIAAQTRRIIISSAGRVRICKPSTDTTCTSTATQ